VGRGGGWLRTGTKGGTLVNTKIKIIHKATEYEEFLHFVGKRHPLERNSAWRSQQGFRGGNK